MILDNIDYSAGQLDGVGEKRISSSWVNLLNDQTFVVFIVFAMNKAINLTIAAIHRNQ